MESIQTISIIGSGNVAFHLCNALKESDCKVVEILSRNYETSQSIAKEFNLAIIQNPRALSGDLVLICTKDDSILDLTKLISEDQKVAYTSGSLDLETLGRKENTGVFYPLQSFSRERKIDYFNIPFLIEATDEIFAQELFDIAWKISHNVSFANSETRRKYHYSAVWINNFTNHFVYQAEKFLQENNLKAEYLKPLLKETVEKLNSMSAYNAQTGPARRHDMKTIEAHLKLTNEDTRELYEIITKSIIKTYPNK